jgi:DNA-binding Lrp family transcriptional regulator
MAGRPDELLQLLQSARQAGLLSRLGAVFAPNTVGSSTLAALAVPERLDAVAAFVSSHAEVNHNYQRDHHFNLWFVVTASDAAAVAEVLSRIHLATGLTPLNLPLLREYHIDLGFALDGSAVRQPQRQPSPSARTGGSSACWPPCVAACRCNCVLSSCWPALRPDRAGSAAAVAGLAGTGRAAALWRGTAPCRAGLSPQRHVRVADRRCRQPRAIARQLAANRR